ncbi:hypothetical protein AWV80_16850 [Cupriavidus sp. UYMU48A]|nr:hypothetical protein AWV80_16850 [Cupriavidus sp. UYMU48A]
MCDLIAQMWPASTRVTAVQIWFLILPHAINLRSCGGRLYADQVIQNVAVAGLGDSTAALTGRLQLGWPATVLLDAVYLTLAAGVFTGHSTRPDRQVVELGRVRRPCEIAQLCHHRYSREQTKSRTAVNTSITGRAH